MKRRGGILQKQTKTGKARKTFVKKYRNSLSYATRQQKPL